MPLRKKQQCGLKYHFITMYLTTSISHAPERNVEPSGGYVSRETCTELAATLTILVPSPTPEYDDLTNKSAKEQNFDDGEQLQVLQLVFCFQPEASNIIYDDRSHG